jgi:hypothetical protein
VRFEHDNRENNEVVEFPVAHQYYEIHVVAGICILQTPKKALEARATSGSILTL